MHSKRKEDWELFKTLIMAFAVALLFRSLVMEPFHIPSGSMKKTLLIGDYLFVNKYSYGYSRYSFPFGLPLFEDRLFTSLPERGDVAVFRPATNPRIDFIKRVIGLPGDRIQMREGVLYINDAPVQMQRLEDFIDTLEDGSVRRMKRYRETLPNGISYEILDDRQGDDLDDTGVYTVPEGHYFMMGDNRDNSKDSRVLNAVGYVPLENFVGRASFIFYSHNGTASLWKPWEWKQALRSERLFTSVQADKTVQVDSAPTSATPETPSVP